ncbi:MAG: 50S ribosomal protein L25/general stress protein Ctc [Bernardetiaceae bacterium]|nr:50S ribosomal protein L25/general stress protein Ctc [Bernardetiaceae bacterium]
MNTLEIVGYERKDTGSKEAAKLRKEAQVPCVLYGTDTHVHFHSPMILFRDLVYTPNVNKVKLNIEGTIYMAILQEVQFHPVSEIILHADFLLLEEGKPVKIDIPVRLFGRSPGVVKGGRLVTKLRKLRIKATPENLPADIPVDISKLELGKSIKVGEVKSANYEIMNSPLVSIASVVVTRTLRKEQNEGAAAAK